MHNFYQTILATLIKKPCRWCAGDRTRMDSTFNNLISNDFEFLELKIELIFINLRGPVLELNCFYELLL